MLRSRAAWTLTHFRGQGYGYHVSHGELELSQGSDGDPSGHGVWDRHALREPARAVLPETEAVHPPRRTRSPRAHHPGRGAPARDAPAPHARSAAVRRGRERSVLLVCSTPWDPLP